MSSIVLNPLWFLITSTLIILLGTVIKVDKYENNTIRNLNNNYSQLLISEKSFEKADIEINTWFKYWVKGQEETKRVVFITKKENNYEVILAKADETLVTFISYKVGKNSLWSEIFK